MVKPSRAVDLSAATALLHRNDVPALLAQGMHHSDHVVRLCVAFESVKKHHRRFVRFAANAIKIQRVVIGRCPRFLCRTNGGKLAEDGTPTGSKVAAANPERGVKRFGAKFVKNSLFASRVQS